MTEIRDVPSLAKAAQEVAALFGKTPPQGFTDWAQRVDDRVAEKAAAKETAGEPVGPVAVTRIRNLRGGDVAYIRHQWLRVELVRTATADPTRIVVVGNAIGPVDGAVDRLWSEPADGLVIIRKRP